MNDDQATDETVGYTELMRRKLPYYTSRARLGMQPPAIALRKKV